MKQSSPAKEAQEFMEALSTNGDKLLDVMVQRWDWEASQNVPAFGNYARKYETVMVCARKLGVDGERRVTMSDASGSVSYSLVKL